MSDVFLGNWADEKAMAASFSMDESDLQGVKVLMAWYGDGDYCGSAEVLFKKAGKLYRVTGSHCSCYGLEGQWEPQETDWATLLHIYVHGYEFDSSRGYEASEKMHERITELLRKKFGVKKVQKPTRQ